MKWREGKQFEQPPTGSFIARCYAVIDLGTQRHEFEGKVTHSRDVRISFELPEELMTGKYDEEAEGKPFSVHFTAKQSLHNKSKLRPFLAGWRGRDFETREEVESFDPKKLVGLPVRLTLVKKKDFVNIASAAPLGKKEKCPKQINKGLFFSLDEDEFDSEIFDKLSEATQKKISDTPEYQALTGGTGSGEPDDTGEHDGTQGEGEPGSEPDDAPF